MPKGSKSKPLHPHQISKIEEWIKQGAKDDSPKGSDSLHSMDNKPVYQTLPLVRTLDFTKDGKYLAQNGFHEVLIAEASTGRLVSRLVGLSERIESVAFSPDGTKIAVAGGQPGRMGEIQVWDWSKEKLLLSHAITYDTLYGVSWSPDGKTIAFGASDTAVRVIDANTAEELVYMAGHDDWVRGTVFSADGKSIFSVSRDKTVKQTDVATERFVGNVTTHTPGFSMGARIPLQYAPTKQSCLSVVQTEKPSFFVRRPRPLQQGAAIPIRFANLRNKSEGYSPWILILRVI